MKAAELTEYSHFGRAQLLRKIAHLQKRILALEERVSFLKKRRISTDRHEANVTGKTAEQFVAKILNAKPTLRNADHDLMVCDGLRLEVKGTACNNCNVGRHSYPRWTWHNFIGVGPQVKSYDRLILVGEAPAFLLTEYKDPTSGFVIFDLPFQLALEIANEITGGSGRFTFQLMARPASARSNGRKLQVWEHQVTRQELKARYGAKAGR